MSDTSDPNGDSNGKSESLLLVHSDFPLLSPFASEVFDIGHAGLRVMLQIWRDASRCHDGRGHFNTEMCVGIRTLWIARRKLIVPNWKPPPPPVSSRRSSMSWLSPLSDHFMGTPERKTRSGLR